MGRWPCVTVHNLQRKISVNVAELEKFAGNAVQHPLQLHQRQRTDLRNLSEIFILVDFHIGGWHFCIGSFSGNRGRLTC